MRHPPSDPLPPRAAIYCRFSSEMQNPRSVVDQVKLCQRYAERQGWPPIPPEAIFVDEQLSGDISIAVGPLVTQRPPHRSRRADFPHRALQRFSLPHQGAGDAGVVRSATGCGTPKWRIRSRKPGQV